MDEDQEERLREVLVAVIETAENYREWVCEQESIGMPRTYYDLSELPFPKAAIREGAFAIIAAAHQKGDFRAVDWWSGVGLETLRRYQAGVGDTPVGLGALFAARVEEIKGLELDWDAFAGSKEAALQFQKLEEAERVGDDARVARILSGGSWMPGSLNTEFTPVDSSNIAGIAYASESHTLSVEFHDGSIYEYSGVPENAYSAFLESASPGSFFHRRVKGAYPYQKVRDSNGDSAPSRKPPAQSAGCLIALVPLAAWVWVNGLL